MKLKPNLFPYPVLNNEMDDYVNSSFSTNVDIGQQTTSKYNLSMEFILKNRDLEKLIEQNKAAFAVHIEGSGSSFRDLLVLEKTEFHIKKEYDINYTGNKIEISPVIILKEFLPEYKNSNFNPEYYEKYSVSSLQKGSILAFESTKECTIDIENREKPNMRSAIRVAENEKKPPESEYISIDTMGDTILINLPQKAYEAYRALSQSSDVKLNLLRSAIVLPALAYVIEQVRNDFIAGEEKEWFLALKDGLNKLGYNDEESFKNVDSLKIAQDIFDRPIENSLYEFYKSEERKDE